MGDGFNCPLETGSLPDTLTSLIFGSHFDRPIPTGVLPSSLTLLRLGYCFNQQIAHGALPNSLTDLQFGHCYIVRIDANMLPPSLTRLKFGFWYNCFFPPHSLPHSITELSVGTMYNQLLVTGCLPKSLTSLELGKCFNQSLDHGVLPASLTYLSLCDNFNKSLVLPNKMRTLHIGAATQLPHHLGVLKLPASMDTMIIDNLCLDKKLPNIPILSWAETQGSGSCESSRLKLLKMTLDNNSYNKNSIETILKAFVHLPKADTTMIYVGEAAFIIMDEHQHHLSYRWMDDQSKTALCVTSNGTIWKLLSV
ncbi:hypothetical protein SAMD00019534_102820 [Acytostelium subglobosum LB1]|uniref:hypothetical protein n=1 Tax=Acytostelium subglobosum LB1 TaxID=1410327 RepID=UPI000645008D|nr:hypothetical protein SAMD00019534_102820 [Acytostelium subglobosum LB1]GAM27107.1 hypothetical protein SAMD00019534_102820 [Acytostelium subglobosum LB1]|eukprot:XP_012749987.1 hypothetical protein SAMD00019534_102820 [Acytostelium subglobosum LB1]